MNSKSPDRRRRRPPGGYATGAVFVVVVTALCILLVTLMLLSNKQDTGIRVWVLNHAPDQVVIINPYNGQVASKFQVADGLKDLAFSRDFKKAYVGNVVDVTNKLTVLDTATYNKERTIEIDGVPQGIGVFPDNDKLAVITASKTNFMAGGFDVLDMNERSAADPTRQKRLYRERGLELTHKIAVGDDGDRIYCLDAKEPLVHVFSFKQESWIKDIYLHGAPEEMLYPPVGDYFYISVLQHRAIYQISKATDEIVGAFIYELHDLEWPMRNGRLRHMAVDSRGEYLVGTNYELKSVAIWRIGDPEFMYD
ncbi:MAG TPA: YncE family protein, partial [Firmicutes bacterium]|nr:YncE family protein [Bacillota bacterium]